ncbi:hypothetical protein CcCBS67573_g03094 [Chytriomyces confervae]|uniref:THIF-type NAD/FAD binding fold domain-containing protein n=1 Tax=Chytriomyces confervae TaxID=246404 RepID=A0A507FH68_9FUNG|nr:SUMO-activating enzyme subunit 1 [Chytriomyces hyalinus]TPX75623.1 hypothetical protein CcCBS67573_g03094 [Chytriomyces confervae]
MVSTRSKRAAEGEEKEGTAAASEVTAQTTDTGKRKKARTSTALSEPVETTTLNHEAVPATTSDSASLNQSLSNESGDANASGTENGAQPTNLTTMDEEEMALYDRQIRLWGMEAQTRMRTASVLVIGVCGLSAEICKNIVLAGVGNVTVLDNQPVSVKDLGANFFLTEADIGANRAEASAPRIRNLNPRVNLTTVNKDIHTIENAFYSRFDLVLVSSKISLATLTHINSVCRDAGIKFVSCAVFGTHGYMFSDLLKYDYVEERNATSDGVTTTLRTKKSQDFASLETACTTRFNSMRPKFLKRVPPLYFALQLMWRFEKKEGRLPSAATFKEDAEKMCSMRDEYITSTGGDVKTLNALLTPAAISALAREASLELSPVCAIVGGIVSQEVLNIVSAKEVDVYNFFCFGDSVGGVIKAFGESPDTAVSGAVGSSSSAPTSSASVAAITGKVDESVVLD